MANWTTVRVKAKNPQVFAEKFLSPYSEEEIKDEKNITDSGDELSKRVDFEKLIPTPQDLQIESGAGSYKNEVEYFPFQEEQISRQKETITPLLEKTYEKGMTQDAYVRVTLPIALANKDRFIEMYRVRTNKEENTLEDITIVLKGFYNFKTYGSVDWYDYHCKHWGTKWNAVTFYVDEERGFAEFQTAWGCPFEILQELAKHTDISVSYVNEDMLSGYGVFSIDTNGNVTDHIVCTPYRELNQMQKIDAIATATALTMGEIYDINEQTFGNYEDDELTQFYGMSREEVLKVAQKSVEEVQEILVELDLC